MEDLTTKRTSRPSLTISELSVTSSWSTDESSFQEFDECSDVATNQHKVSLSRKFMLLSLLCSMLIAFFIGRGARFLYIERPARALVSEFENEARKHEQPTFPPLMAHQGHEVPHTRYSSKIFDTARSVTMSSWLATSRESQRFEEAGPGVTVDNERERQGAGEASPSRDKTFIGSDVASCATETGAVDTTGEHLMVDIKNVDGAFLNSEPLLARAMVDLVQEANLPLLSYHCHGFSPSGVSCVGILLRNYVAFHTWPEAGVITFDLVDTESKTILPLLSTITQLFGVQPPPSYPGQVVQPPEIRWAYKTRGFPPGLDEIRNDVDVKDLDRYVLGDLGMERKEKVASVGTDFQQIDVYDASFPSIGSLGIHQKPLPDETSYVSQHPFLFRPNRVFLLDGWIQSTLFYEAAYHEALVHPALFAHHSPKRIAIIGGGEGATLREVLKHNTVKEAVMIEIDESMVTVSREHLPEWSDCSDLVGSSAWCVDDPRATVYYEDALNWFMDRYSGDNPDSEGLFDIIIMDALDPESEVPIAKALYVNDRFMRTFYSSLSDDGILVMQLGEAPDTNDPNETYSKFRNRVTTISFLEALGFDAIHTYEESHCGFAAPWSFVVGFKSQHNANRWFSNAASVDLEIHKRTVSTKSGNNPLRYFDGQTMVSYQAPNKAVESVFCRRSPTPEDCRFAAYDDDDERSQSTHAEAFLCLETGDVVTLSTPQFHVNKSMKFNPVVDRHTRHGTSLSPCDINVRNGTIVH